MDFQYAIIAPVAAGLIAAASAIASGISNNIQERKNTKRTLAANRELAEYQYSKDLDMWNKQNEYNSPEKQMQRYDAAGLNPNLIYSQGNSGNAATMPKFQAPTAQYNYSPIIDPVSAIGAFQDMQLKQAQYDNLRAQREATIDLGGQRQLQNEFLNTTMFDRVQKEWLGAKKLDWDQMLSNMKGQSMKQMFPFQLQVQQENARRGSFQTQKLMSDISNTNARTEYQKLMNEWSTTKMISQFGLGMMNAIPKYFGRRVGSGSKPPTFNQKTRASSGTSRVDPFESVRYRRANHPESYIDFHD